MKRTTLILLSLALVSGQAWSQIYKTVDEDGNVSFSDTPPASGNSEQIQLQQTNSTPAPEVPEFEPEPDEGEEPDDIAGIPLVTITAPANETTIPMGPGNFTVSAALQPALGKGQALQLVMDGEPQGEPQAAQYWDMTNTPPGEHDLVIEVVDSAGDIITSSDPVRVYVLRPSVLRPRAN